MFTPVFFWMPRGVFQQKGVKMIKLSQIIFPDWTFRIRTVQNFDCELKTLLWNFKEKYVALEVRGRDSTRLASNLPLLQNRKSGISCCSRVSRKPQHHSPLERDVVIVQRPKKNDELKNDGGRTHGKTYGKKREGWRRRRKDTNTNVGRPVCNQRFWNMEEFITHSAWKASSCRVLEILASKKWRKKLGKFGWWSASCLRLK